MSVLSIIATPIGNLEDITLRALRTLKECDVIYAEDTRVTAKLLAKYDIKKSVQRLDATTEIKKTDEIIARLEAGDETIKAMVPTIYAAVDPRLHPAAAHSVLAHMIELVRTGRVSCEGAPGLDTRYLLQRPTT